MSFIEAYNPAFHYDIMALSETYLIESIKDEDIKIEGYSREVFCSNNPNSKKRVSLLILYTPF